MIGRVKTLVGADHFTVVGFEFLVRLYCFQILGGHDEVIQLVSFIINRLQGCERKISIAVSAVTFVIVQSYYLIDNIARIHELSDGVSMCFVEQDFGSLFVEYNYFPSFFNVDFVNETSLEKFYYFHFRMVGIYSGKIQVDIFRSEAKVHTSLIYGCSGLDDMIRKILIGRIQVFVIQSYPPSFLQTVV